MAKGNGDLHAKMGIPPGQKIPPGTVKTAEGRKAKETNLAAALRKKK